MENIEKKLLLAIKIKFSEGKKLYQQKDFSKALIIFKELEQEINELSRKKEKKLRKIYKKIANTYMQCNDIINAIEYIKLYIRDYQIDSYKSLGKAYFFYAQCLDKQNDIPEAIKIYQKCDKKIQKITPVNNLIIASLYENLGSCYGKLKNIENQWDYYKKSKTNYKKILPKQPLSLASIYNNLGICNYNHGNIRVALKYHKKSKKLYEAFLLGNEINLSRVYNNIGIAYNELKNTSRAELYYNKAKELLEKTINLQYPDKHLDISYYIISDELSNIYYNLGTLYLANNKLDLSLDYYLQAKKKLKMLSKIKNLRLERIYINLGLIFMSIGDLISAKNCLKKALKLQGNRISDKGDFLDIKHESDKVKNIQDEFQDLLRRQNEVLLTKNNKIVEHLNLGIIYLYIGKYYQIEGDSDINMKSYEKSIEVFNQFLSPNDEFILYLRGYWLL